MGHPPSLLRRRTGELIEEVEALEERARRRDILVDDQALYDFYAARVPETVVSGAHFDRWWRDERRTRPDLLTFTRELLINPTAAEDVAGRPDTWVQGDLELKLSYRFEPGAPHDGVTVHVPLKTLPQLRSEGFEWLVPALRAELVVALIRSLPKDLRKRLVPVPDVAAKVLERLQPRHGPLLTALAAEIEAQRGVRIPPDAWDLSRLPSYLRMTFSVEDEAGNALAAGQDLDALRERARPNLRAALAAATKQARAHRPDELDVRDDPQGGRAPGHRADRARVPVARRRGRDRRPARAREPGGAGAEHARRHAAGCSRSRSRRPLRQYQGQARQRGAARADRGAARLAARRARGRRDGRDLLADGRAPAGRCGTRRPSSACATTSPATPPTRRPGSWPHVVKILQAARDVRRKLDELRGAGGRPTCAATSPSSSAGSSSPASSRRPARPAGRRRALPARRRVAARAAEPSRRRRPRPHARRRTSSRTSTATGSRSCPRAGAWTASWPRCRGCSRSCAMSQFAQAHRDARPGVEPQDPADPRRGGALTRTTRGAAGRSRFAVMGDHAR